MPGAQKESKTTERLNRLRANSGSFLAPNKTKTITRINTHSDGPGTPSSSIFMMLSRSRIETRLRDQKVGRDRYSNIWYQLRWSFITCSRERTCVSAFAAGGS